MSEKTKTIEITSYVCDLCGTEEEVNPERIYATGTVRITVQSLEDDEYRQEQPVTLDVCLRCQGVHRKADDIGIRGLVRKAHEMIKARTA